MALARRRSSGLLGLAVAAAALCNLGAAGASGGSLAAAGAVPGLATVTISGQSSATTPLGSAVSDRATLAGGDNPTGTITFALYGPNDATCATPIDTTTDKVQGNGTYPSATFVPSSAGTYEWIASYGGDANNGPANEGSGACTNPTQAVSVIEITVHALTGALTVGSGMAQQQPLACPSGASLIGGGAEVFWSGASNVPPFWTNASGVLEPINGSEVRGTTPSDASGNPSASGTPDPAYWDGSGGFAGQNETGDDATTYAMCMTGDPAATEVVTASVPEPTVAATDAEATAVCPTGTVLVGGGALTNIPGPSVKPIGSFPSNAAGVPSSSGTTDPGAWSAVGEAGGLLNGGSSGVMTTAFALCLSDPTLQTQVVESVDVDHPAGPGNTNAGSDPAANVTATCPASTMLLQGGAFPTGDQPGQDPISFGTANDPQQGVHLRGSFPVDSSGDPAVDGATGIASWTAIVQSGGQATPGTDSYAWALCATPASAGASADLSISNAASPNPVAAGSPLTSTIEVTNAGPDAATAVTMSDPLPAGVTFQSATPTTGSCALASDTVTCDLGTLASGGSSSISLVVTPTVPGSLSNTASVTANEPDPNTSNNSATSTVTVSQGGGPKVVPGLLCRPDGKIAGRGSTLQGRAQTAFANGFTGDACGDVADPTAPAGEDVPVSPAGNSMVEYNEYTPGGSTVTGSGYGLKAMACRTDAFAGTDTPYTTNQLQQLNAALPKNATPNLTNQYILGQTSGVDDTCQSAPTADFGASYYPPFPPYDGGPSPAASSYPNTTAGAADQVAPMMSFPIGGSAVAVVVNLAGVCTNGTPTTLEFTGIQLSELFGGDIATWNDARLTTNNPSLASDDCTGAVTRVVSADDSGTTQILKTYLSHVDPSRTGGTGETCDTGTGADGNSTWTELIAASPNTNWPGFTAPPGTGNSQAAGNGCSAVRQGDVTGDDGALDECEGNTGGGNTITGIGGAICYADLPDFKNFDDASPNGGGHGGVPGCSPCGGIVASVQNATLTSYESPAKVTTANCNFGTVTSPTGSDGGIGMTTGSSFTPGSAIPAGWDTWAFDNPEGDRGDVTDTGGVYPICGLTFDMVWSGLSDSAANSSAIDGLTVDQRRTIYAFFSYILSSAGQNLLPSAYYQALPQAVLGGIRAEFQAKF